MARQLKRWESPRSEGRNHKGKGGSARQRQRKKQFQRLRAKLKQGIDNTNGKGSHSLPVSVLWRGSDLHILHILALVNDAIVTCL